VSKFAWHLPLHRQTQMLTGQGIDLDRSTLVHWIERAAWWLKPLHTLLLEHVMSATKIFCDDTPLPVLDHTRRRTRIGRIISAGSAACSRSMAIPAMTTWPNRVVPPARSRSPTAWRMLGGVLQGAQTYGR
jgi:Transposase IS66 family